MPLLYGLEGHASTSRLFRYGRIALNRAFSRAWAKTGNRMAARMAIMAITTSSSISVKARHCVRRIALLRATGHPRPCGLRPPQRARGHAPIAVRLGTRQLQIRPRAEGLLPRVSLLQPGDVQALDEDA